jgi:hypothetical protein
MKVTHLQMTKRLFIPKVGELGRSTLESSHNVHMRLHSSNAGVEVYMEAQRVGFIVPWSLIEIAVFEESLIGKELKAEADKIAIAEAKRAKKPS